MSDNEDTEMDVVTCSPGSSIGPGDLAQAGGKKVLAEKIVVNHIQGRKIPDWLSFGDESGRVDAKDDLNLLVMNYLLMEGHKEAAVAFARESNTPSNLVTSHQKCSGYMDERIRIRRAVCSGDIPLAIVYVNDLDTDILEQNPDVYFGLRLQQLIEIIRTGDKRAAVEFARTELAAICEENEKVLPSMEEVMSLLLYDDPDSSPASHLMSRAHLECLSSELNAAIMRHFDLPVYSGLHRLLQTIGWSQDILKDGNVTHWRMEPLGEMNFIEQGKHTLKS